MKSDEEKYLAERNYAKTAARNYSGNPGISETADEVFDPGL